MNRTIGWINDCTILRDSIIIRLNLVCKEHEFRHQIYSSSKEFIENPKRCDLIVLDHGELGTNSGKSLGYCQVLLRTISDHTSEVVIMSGFGSEVIQNAAVDLNHQQPGTLFYSTTNVNTWISESWLTGQSK